MTNHHRAEIYKYVSDGEQLESIDDFFRWLWTIADKALAPYKDVLHLVSISVFYGRHSDERYIVWWADWPAAEVTRWYSNIQRSKTPQISPTFRVGQHGRRPGYYELRFEDGKAFLDYYRSRDNMAEKEEISFDKTWIEELARKISCFKTRGDDGGERLNLDRLVCVLFPIGAYTPGEEPAVVFIVGSDRVKTLQAMWQLRFALTEALSLPVHCSAEAAPALAKAITVSRRVSLYEVNDIERIKDYYLEMFPDGRHTYYELAVLESDMNIVANVVDSVVEYCWYIKQRVDQSVGGEQISFGGKWVLCKLETRNCCRKSNPYGPMLVLWRLSDDAHTNIGFGEDWKKMFAGLVGSINSLSDNDNKSRAEFRSVDSLVNSNGWITKVARATISHVSWAKRGGNEIYTNIIAFNDDMSSLAKYGLNDVKNAAQIWLGVEVGRSGLLSSRGVGHHGGDSKSVHEVLGHARDRGSLIEIRYDSLKRDQWDDIVKMFCAESTKESVVVIETRALCCFLYQIK